MKKSKKNKISKLLFKVYDNIVYIFSFGILLFLNIDALLHTAYMPPLSSSYDEVTFFYKDNIIVHLVVLLAFILVFYLLKKHIHINKKNVKKVIKIVLIFQFVISFFWVFMANSFPRADDYYVYDAAIKFSTGDYTSLLKGNYLFLYPFQLGLVFFEHCLYYLFGNNTILLFQIINCFSVFIAFWCLIRIFDIIFEHHNNTILLSFLLLLSFNITFYCSFMYGNLISFSLSIISVYFWILSCKSNLFNKKLFLMVLSIILISISYLIKSTSLIVIIALIILNFLIFIEKRQKVNLIYIIALIISFSLPLKCVYSYYENVSGIKINSGVPKIGWVVMGINEGPRENGWYNGWTVDTYYQLKYNDELLKLKAYKEIQNTLEKFIYDSKYTLNFFYKKLSSEWNNPTYQSLWVLTNTGNNKIAKSLVSGNLNSWFYRYANYFQQIIYFGALLYLIFYRKSSYLENSIMLIIIGGFVFYTFWEAKGQYVFQYFVLMIPYASLGYNKLYWYLKNKFRKKQIS